MYLFEYKLVFYTFFVALFLSILLLVISYVLSPKKNDLEKLSAYECGFESYGDARIPFDIHFYLIAILFIIFDLEIAFLFPWCLSISLILPEGFWSMVIFLLILTIGFLYEWSKGALNWS